MDTTLRVRLKHPRRIPFWKVCAAAVVAVCLSLALALGTAAAGFWGRFVQDPWSGQYNIREPRFTRPAWIEHQAGRIRIIDADVDPSGSVAYACVHRFFSTVIAPVEWIPGIHVDGREPPSWSVHRDDAHSDWPADTQFHEVGMGLPFRWIILTRATPPYRAWSFAVIPPTGHGQQVYGALNFIWRIRWWALIVNIAFFVPIVLALRKGPWAVQWLRGYLRRRRGVCVACAYPVRGLALCPECGRDIEGAATRVVQLGEGSGGSTQSKG